MNDIIKKIEAEQLKAEVPEFNVGDTVKVYAKSLTGSGIRIFSFAPLCLSFLMIEQKGQHTFRTLSLPLVTILLILLLLLSYQRALLSSSVSLFLLYLCEQLLLSLRLVSVMAKFSQHRFR